MHYRVEDMQKVYPYVVRGRLLLRCDKSEGVRPTYEDVKVRDCLISFSFEICLENTSIYYFSFIYY